MIFQHFNLASNLTVFDNIAFTLRAEGRTGKETTETVRKYLSLVGLTEKADVYPSKLSGGQKQRVAIARALVGGAKILLCDEPTSALDAETTASILRLIKELSQTLGITVVIITHELDVIKSVCSRCAMMDGGKVAEIGGVYDIFTHPKEAFTLQLIGHTLRHEVPQNILRGINGMLLRLTFRGERANMPVISEATLRFGVRFNIIVGRIEYIEDKLLGVLYVNPVGDADAVRESLAFLRETVEEVEVIDYERV